ncbi:MAG: response regulator transcription factor [Actinomycetes bacterium]
MSEGIRRDVPLGRRSPQAKTRVVVADKNVISRVGIRSILERNPDIAVVAESTTYEGALDSVDEHGPDVLIIDLDLGHDTTRGLQICEQITERYPMTKILVLAQTLSELIVVEALRRGVTGYLCQEEIRADELIKGVRSVQDGETVLGKGVGSMVARGLGSPRGTIKHLSDREIEVIRLIAKGLSNKQVAANLFVSESTIKFHLQNASKKLGAHRRAEIVHLATSAGLL